MRRLALFVILASRPTLAVLLASRPTASLLAATSPKGRGLAARSAAAESSEEKETTSRVEVFSSSGCGFCTRAKKRLAALGVPYTEVDVGSSDERRRDMSARAGGRTSVPQIFVGGRHLGGCDELLAADASGALRLMLAPLGIVPTEPAAVDPDPDPAEAANRADSGQRLSSLAPRGGILNHQLLAAREASTTAAELKLPGAEHLVSSLQKQILRLYDDFVSADGKRVEYARMASAPAFATFAQCAAQLRQLPPSALPSEPAARLAFWLNLYNSLVIHGTAVAGAPADEPASRADFFGGRTGVAYEVGGFRLSLDDIEHGIIRGCAVVVCSSSRTVVAQ